MNILVTGAAGYIGSIVTERLLREGNFVIALDNLKQGHREAVDPGAVFVRADLGNLEKLDDVFHRYKIEAVIHLAADTRVEYSMTHPKTFFQNNVVCGANLLNTMLKFGVHKIVFSSSAAVYGEPDKVPIEENDPKKVISPYGESKLIFERILHWYGRAYGIRSISLRYFNAAGASKRFGEDHNPETHLIPNVLKVALGQLNEIPIYGTDYPTKDRSCIRDYVHVLDIAKAHILALEKLDEAEESPVLSRESERERRTLDIGHRSTGLGQSSRVYNLGNGEGYSVFEVVETARKVTGAQIPVVMHPRRPGDPAVLIASSDLARSELGWQAGFPKLDVVIGSAWQWQKRHPYGYASQGST